MIYNGNKVPNITVVDEFGNIIAVISDYSSILSRGFRVIVDAKFLVSDDGLSLYLGSNTDCAK